MFKRDLNKYIVLKTSDVRSLSELNRCALQNICDEIEANRINNNKAPLNGVFVRDNDPIHDLVWKQLEYLSVSSDRPIPFEYIPSEVLKELIRVYGSVDPVGSYGKDVVHDDLNKYKKHTTMFTLQSNNPKVVLNGKNLVKQYNAVRFVCNLYKYQKNSSWYLISCIPEHFTIHCDRILTGEQLVYPWLKPNIIFSVKDIMFNGAATSINIIDKSGVVGPINRTIHFQKMKENGEFVDKYAISKQLQDDIFTQFGIDYSKV